MSIRSEQLHSVRNQMRVNINRDAALRREASGVDKYIELDEIELIHKYDEIHALEAEPLFYEQRQLVDFISHALLNRIEHKISASFRAQLEQEAQVNNQEMEAYGRTDQFQH